MCVQDGETCTGGIEERAIDMAFLGGRGYERCKIHLTRHLYMANVLWMMGLSYVLQIYEVDLVVPPGPRR